MRLLHAEPRSANHHLAGHRLDLGVTLWPMTTDVSAAAVPELTEIRANIDATDREIIALIASRQRWVEAAGRAKAASAQPRDAVRAPARVEAVIDTVRAQASSVGASPEVVEATYRAMIAAFIELELGVHAGDK